MEIKLRKKCAVCNAELLTVLNLGKHPLANHLLTEQELSRKEKRYPLTLCFCETCFLLQLGQVVSPSIMYKDYLYIPSGSRTLVSHFEELCNSIDSFRRKRGFVLDVGSNDGSLLRFFKQKNYRILGVDPASKIAEVATKSGILTLPFLFNSSCAKRLVKRFGRVDVVTATNVFAHVENLYDLYRGIDLVLSDEGICVIEVSYLFDMIENVLFDSIYHEHIYYFSVCSLLNLFEKASFQIFNIDHVHMHGGSLRIWLKKKKNRKIKVNHKIINQFAIREKQFGLCDKKLYLNFGQRIQKLKTDLTKLLFKLKKQKKKIVGFGAPAKGNVLLNFFGINHKTLDFVVDSTVYKQFRYMPVSRLQILPEETIYIDKPDYLLVLAWNFIDEIREKNKIFKGKFIVPLPKLIIN